jgi:hypothetical protein
VGGNAPIFDDEIPAVNLDGDFFAPSGLPAPWGTAARRLPSRPPLFRQEKPRRGTCPPPTSHHNDGISAPDGCPAKPKIEKLPDTAHDGTTVTKKTYGPGRQGAEVVLLVIEGGGHTWPGHMTIEKLLGKATQQISANDLIWEFFQKHPMTRNVP